MKYQVIIFLITLSIISNCAKKGDLYLEKKMISNKKITNSKK
jgi:hypothetical protein